MPTFSELTPEQQYSVAQMAREALKEQQQRGNAFAQQEPDTFLANRQNTIAQDPRELEQACEFFPPPARKEGAHPPKTKRRKPSPTMTPEELRHAVQGLVSSAGPKAIVAPEPEGVASQPFETKSLTVAEAPKIPVAKTPPTATTPPDDLPSAPIITAPPPAIYSAQQPAAKMAAPPDIPRNVLEKADLFTPGNVPSERDAVIHARRRMEAMTIYSKEETAKTATSLLRALVLTAPKESYYGAAKRVSDAVDGKISVRTLKEILEGTRDLNPATLAASGAVETLANLLVTQSSKKEVTNYLMGIPLASVKEPAGETLFQYAETHDATMLDYMQLMQRQKKLTLEQFCQDVLGLPQDAYRRIVSAQCKEHHGEEDVVVKAMDRLGLSTETDRLLFTKMALGIPRDTNQEYLNDCFVKKDSAYFVDMDAQETARTVALSRFFELLRMTRGKRTFEDIAAAIYPEQDQVADRRELYFAIRNSAPRGGGDAAAETCMKKKSIVTLHPKHACVIAAYAFPENTALQEQALDFLSNEQKYHRRQTFGHLRRAQHDHDSLPGRA